MFVPEELAKHIAFEVAERHPNSKLGAADYRAIWEFMARIQIEDAKIQGRPFPPGAFPFR